MSNSPTDVDALADEIRASETLYVDAATAAFRDRVRMEYCRIRGYAVEAGKQMMDLQVNVKFGFDPANRFVIVESVPQFVPQPGKSRSEVAQPKKR